MSTLSIQLPKIERRKCGKYDLHLPILGMGCWAFGGGEYWGPQSQKDVDAVVRNAIDCGCSFFDTAEAYNNGTSEESLGKALCGIPRDHVMIATKVSPSNCAPETLAAHCEASLKRLRTDYADIYMVHWPITPHSIRHFTAEDIATPSLSAAFETLTRLKEAGKIRHIGVSNFGRAKLEEAIATGAQIVLNELPYSLLARAIELDILPYCRQEGIGVLGYMPLMQGVLAGTYASLADLPRWRRRTRHFDSRRSPKCRHGLPGAEPETSAALESIRSIAGAHGMTMPELALKWAFGGEGITSCLCGSRTIKQLRGNIEAASAPLDHRTIKHLKQVTQPLLEKLGPSFDYYENSANDRTK